MNISIRLAETKDVSGMKTILNTIELFPAEYLDDMIADFFNNSETEDIWFTATLDDEPVGLGYCAPEKFTDGTFNLYAIGIRKDLQDKGIGGKMMRFIEDLLREKGHRILIVETSGSDDLGLTRAFYKKLDYRQEAVIREFWQAGEDKVIFWKKLNG